MDCEDPLDALLQECRTEREAKRMEIDADPLGEFCNAFDIAQEPDHLQSLHDGKTLMVLILLVKFK